MLRNLNHLQSRSRRAFSFPERSTSEFSAYDFATLKLFVT
jgi:hypothetical protein